MSFSCSDKETLIAYIYGECDAETRNAVDVHLSACPACAQEMDGFGRVRLSLAEWSPPGRVGSYRLVREEQPAAPAPARVLRPARWWPSPLPALARVAAGILLFAGGAALANLDVRYDKDGFAVRTGWWKTEPVAARETPGPAPAAAVAPVSVPVPASAETATRSEAPWRADLAALENQLRREMRQQTTLARAAASEPGTVATPPASDAVERRILASLQAMIDDSAQRQQLWTAYRINQAIGDFQAQLKADGTLPASVAPRTRPMERPLFPVSLKK